MGVKEDEIRSLLFIDLLPYDLCIETEMGYKVVIPKGATIPCRRSVEVALSEENQRELLINVYRKKYRREEEEEEEEKESEKTETETKSEEEEEEEEEEDQEPSNEMKVSAHFHFNFTSRNSAVSVSNSTISTSRILTPSPTHSIPHF